MGPIHVFFMNTSSPWTHGMSEAVPDPKPFFSLLLGQKCQDLYIIEFWSNRLTLLDFGSHHGMNQTVWGIVYWIKTRWTMASDIFFFWRPEANDISCQSGRWVPWSKPKKVKHLHLEIDFSMKKWFQVGGVFTFFGIFFGIFGMS